MMRHGKLTAAALGALLAACSASETGEAIGGAAGVGGQGGSLSVGSGGFVPGDDDPRTCAEAEEKKSYLGCDFWPTVVPNQVWSIFDYALAVGNGGDAVAEVEVTRGGMVVREVEVQPRSLAIVYLPWVAALKGPDALLDGRVVPFTSSVRVDGGAYHLTSSVPVALYQFNALEYAPTGGPPGKSWNNCPGDLSSIGCFSYSNDASLLLPSTSLTGHYRLAGLDGWAFDNSFDGQSEPDAGIGGYLAITGVAPSADVSLALPAGVSVVGGHGVPAIAAGDSASFSLAAGDVVVVVGPHDGDLSGALVSATAAVQVIHGHPCRFVPADVAACDHLEESVPPAETLGKHYLVARPTGPSGTPVSHYLRIYGNFDGTTLTYPAGAPEGAPATLAAGEVADLGIVDQDFEVRADQPVAVSSFLLGAPLSGNGSSLGDPSQSVAVAVEQYRTSYVFLAPRDYPVSFVDVTMPLDAAVTVDGEPAPVPEPITGGYGVARIALDAEQGGAHRLEASRPVGIQVVGYGDYTSYYYPGGLDLEPIAPPPIE
jgi:hypothetical protein